MTKNDNCLKKLNSDAIHCALSYLFSKIEENRNYKIIKVIFNVVELSKLNENMLQKNLRIAAKKGYHRIIENIVNKNEQFFNYIMEIFKEDEDTQNSVYCIARQNGHCKVAALLSSHYKSIKWYTKLGGYILVLLNLFTPLWNWITSFLMG